MVSFFGYSAKNQNNFFGWLIIIWLYPLHYVFILFVVVLNINSVFHSFQTISFSCLASCILSWFFWHDMTTQITKFFTPKCHPCSLLSLTLQLLSLGCWSLAVILFWSLSIGYCLTSGPQFPCWLRRFERRCLRPWWHPCRPPGPAEINYSHNCSVSKVRE